MQAHHNGYADVADIHRKMQEEESAENEKQGSKKSSSQGLTISSAGDPSETQADTIAKKVASGAKVNGEAFNTTSVTVNASSEEDEMEIPDGFSSKLNAASGGGSPLDDNTRGQMESSFGTDLSDVRVHTGSAADDLSQSINAKAFAHGKDIYFKEGQYNPGSASGKELLTHELVHTQQQSGPGVKPKVQRQMDELHGEVFFTVQEIYGSMQSIFINQGAALKHFYESLTADTPGKVDPMDIVQAVLGALFSPFFGGLIRRGLESFTDLGAVAIDAIMERITTVQETAGAVTEKGFEFKDLLEKAGEKKKNKALLDFYKQLDTFFTESQTNLLNNQGRDGKSMQKQYNELLISNKGEAELMLSNLKTLADTLHEEVTSIFSINNQEKRLAMQWLRRNVHANKKNTRARMGSTYVHIIIAKNWEIEEAVIHGPFGEKVAEFLNTNYEQEVFNKQGTGEINPWNLSGDVERSGDDTADLSLPLKITYSAPDMSNDHPEPRWAEKWEGFGNAKPTQGTDDEIVKALDKNLPALRNKTVKKLEGKG